MRDTLAHTYARSQERWRLDGERGLRGLPRKAAEPPHALHESVDSSETLTGRETEGVSLRMDDGGWRQRRR